MLLFIEGLRDGMTYFWVEHLNVMSSFLMKCFSGTGTRERARRNTIATITKRLTRCIRIFVMVILFRISCRNVHTPRRDRAFVPELLDSFVVLKPPRDG